MATILVLSPGSKFIPKWRDANLKFTFKKFEDKLITKQNVFLETAPVLFVLKRALQKFFKIGYEKNKIHVINDTDKNLEPTNAE